jgi:predicted nucleic acid-binding protein
MFDADKTRRQQTAIFWDAVQSGEIVAVVSNVLDAETENSRELVQAFLDTLPASHVKRVLLTAESDALAKRYIAEKVISENSLNDCRHVALATYNADGIVSWNLRDMVNRRERYNRVNTMQKCRKIEIITPNRYKEICHDET